MSRLNKPASEKKYADKLIKLTFTPKGRILSTPVKRRERKKYYERQRAMYNKKVRAVILKRKAKNK